ncbi:MAG: aldehyde dehydrogenase family protein [Mycobacteriaceae bacterium]|nr:aldehyde dehydrogenase family protein [Mycobacteriaceae bacterium]
MDRPPAVGRSLRSESGRCLEAKGPDGAHLDNYCWASRKDFRDAVVAARAAQPGWEKATAYNRGQILYRAAEMLESRREALAAEVSRSHGVTLEQARTGVGRVCDRLVHHAGWTDKYQQVFGSVNPVASPHFNFTNSLSLCPRRSSSRRTSVENFFSMRSSSGLHC